MEQDDIVKRLSNFDWGDITKKLTAFVIHYMNYCTGKKYKDWNLPLGYKPEDIALKAITDVLDGTRNWDPEKSPDFLKYLQFSVCRSIISNLYNLDSHKRKEPANQSDYFKTDGYLEFEYYSGTQINFGLSFEQHIDNGIFLKHLETELCDDEIGQMVLLSVLDGNTSRVIAKDLGIEVNEVSNAKKRIKRAAENILNSLNAKR